MAAFGGAVQLPRDAVNHTIDLRLIVDVFVVVVIGGLGSVGGAFLAAVLVSELEAFGILVLPGVSLVLVFVVMAAGAGRAALRAARPCRSAARGPCRSRTVAPGRR